MKYWGKILAVTFSALMLCSTSQPISAKNKKKTPSVQQPAAIYGKQNLTAEISRIVNGVDPSATIGVHVKSMKYGDVIYTHNEQHLFVPASILKVLTAQAALLYLGPQYKFKTSLLTDAKSIGNGVINGNIYLVHSGDPSLTFYDLIDLMTTLKSQGIQRINGNVYIDNTAYDQENIAPGWVWNDTRYCYGAPINASIINHNCLSFQVAPSKSIGYLASIVESPRYYYSIQNSVVTKSSSAKSCYVRLGNNEDGSISVTGCLPKGRSQGVSTVVNNIVEYNKSMMRSLFMRSGITVNGSIEAGTAPAHLSVIATHESEPLNVLITEMLKKSDNIIAGSLFKKMGALYSKQPGTWENGSSAVSQILSQRAGVDTWRMHAVDGSGLSRFNQVSPAQMMQVLNFGFHHGATSYDFISALPIAGVDGTLKLRLRNVARKVRAKTGTMSGVVALAGYAISKDKEPIAFVIIVNGRTGLGWKYKDVEDKIVTALTKYTRV